jgi:hypothetical protein
MKAARGLRGKFRTSIKDILYNTKELGITPKTSALTVSNHVEMLVFGDRYLDAPYPVSYPHFFAPQTLTPGVETTEQCS